MSREKSVSQQAWRVGLLLAACAVSAGIAAGAGRTQAAAGVQAAMPPGDPEIALAEALVGRALFLRGFYSANDLSYDASGRVEGTPKSDDWTLAGIDLKKAERRGPKTIYLEGVRVAVRYNPDNHHFERHPQKYETVRLLIADAGTVRGLESALDAVFAQGIDPRLQRAAPVYWQHYFNPGLAFPPDALANQQVYAVGNPQDTAQPITPPAVAHKVDAKMTGASEEDRVQGTVQMRIVIDATGTPQRVVIGRPLGYGLDARAVESVSKWKFTPALREGKPVPVVLLVNYDFAFVNPPHR